MSSELTESSEWTPKRAKKQATRHKYTGEYFVKYSSTPLIQEKLSTSNVLTLLECLKDEISEKQFYLRKISITKR